jgi:hypothetical protein
VLLPKQRALVAVRTSRIACGGRERSSTWRSASGAPCVPKGASRIPGDGVAFRRKLASALASAAFCSRKAPYLALARRWCSRRTTCVPKEHIWRFAETNRRVSPRRNATSRKRRTKPKFVRPEVWPTPAGRTDLRSLTKPRQRQHHLTRMRAPQLRFAATPWSSAHAPTSLCDSPTGRGIAGLADPRGRIRR